MTMELLHLEGHLRVVGILLMLLAMLNLFLPKRFGWGAELAKVSLLTRQVFIVHCVFIVLVLVMMGVASFWYAPLLVARTPLATVVLFGLAAFWLLRLAMQFFFYSPKLWRGNRFNTGMHILFSCVWTYFAMIYAAAWVLSMW